MREAGYLSSWLAVTSLPNDTPNLFAGLGVRLPGRHVCFQSFGGALKVSLYIPLCTVDVVSEHVQLCPISLRLDSHSFLLL